MPAALRFTDTSHGSFALGEPGAVVDARRHAVVDMPWTWLRQVHGPRCVVVDAPGAMAGSEADAAVTTVPGAVLSVITADCAPVLLAAPGVIGAAHAGWRGLVAGVLEETVSAMRDAGADHISAWLGPCIRGRCYEFGEDELDEASTRLGPEVRTETSWGTPAFDVAVGVQQALRSVGVTDLVDNGTCTACSPVHWSYRVRGDVGRQAALIWLES